MSKKHRDKSIVQKRPTATIVETHWNTIIVILLFVLPFIYFAGFLNPHTMIAGSDYLVGGYPFEKWTAEQHKMPLWYPHVFGGVPVLGSPVGGPLAPLGQLRAFIPPQVVLAMTFIIVFFLAGIGTYLYLKDIGLSRYSAAVGAVIYQFIGNLATTPNAGHAGRAASIALFPLMLFCVHRGLATKKFLYFVLTSCVTAFAFYEGHFQITYYGLLFIIGYVVFFLIARRREYSRGEIARVLGYGVCSVIIICLLMAAVWLPVLGGLGTAARGVERGYEYATSWSMSPRELIDLVIPTYSGLLDKYWGFNHFKIHIEYFGMLAFIFAVIAIILFWKRPYVRLYAITIIVVLCVALGGYTPFFRIFYTLLPGFRLFRAPALSFYLVSFSFVVLGTIGFENLVVTQGGNGTLKRKFYILTGAILAILCIVGIVCALGQDSIVQSMQESLGRPLSMQFGQRLAQMKLQNIEANFPDFVGGIWRTFAICAVIFGIGILAMRRRMRPWVLAVLAICLTLIDQLPFVAKYLPKAPSPEVYYAADDVVRFLKQDKSVYRVFPYYYYDKNTDHATDSYLLYHDIQSAGGYIPNPIQRYQEFIGAGTSVMFSPMNLIQYPRFADMLNIKYIIAPTLPDDVTRYDAQTQRTIEMLRQYLSRYTLAYTGRNNSVYFNPSALPRAYVVPDYTVVGDSEVLTVLKSSSFNPYQTVVLEEDPKVSHPAEQMGLAQADIIEYTANKIQCTLDCPYAGFLVLADNWHPDWKVYVDGKEEHLYYANYVFRAVHLTSGKHSVTFLYKSAYFDVGKIISLVALIAVIATFVVSSRAILRSSKAPL